jgi:hypothetical protein
MPLVFVLANDHRVKRWEQRRRMVLRDRVMPATKRSDSATTRNPRPIYGVNERRKDLDNNLAIQRSAVVAEEDRP